jgi:hypothetical protein
MAARHLRADRNTFRQIDTVIQRLLSLLHPVPARCFAFVATQWPFLRVHRGRIAGRRVIFPGALLAPIAQRGPSRRRRSIPRGWAVVLEVLLVYTPKRWIRPIRLVISWLYRMVSDGAQLVCRSSILPTCWRAPSNYKPSSLPASGTSMVEMAILVRRSPISCQMTFVISVLFQMEENTIKR